MIPFPQTTTAVARLRARLADTNDIIVGPGVYDGITARVALRAGFDCLYMVNLYHRIVYITKIN